MTPLSSRPTPITDSRTYKATDPMLDSVDAVYCRRLEQANAALVEALQMALRQNEHDMLLSGDERHQIANLLAAVSAHVKGE
jgi:hypothetical protein